MSRKSRKIFINAVLALFFFTGFSQTPKINKSVAFENNTLNNNALKIKWGKPISTVKKGKTYSILAFENVSYIEAKNYLPYLALTTPCKSGYKLNAIIEPVETTTLTADEENCVNKIYLTNNFEIAETHVKIFEKIPYMFSKLVPLRINKQSGKTEKLISYRVEWQSTGTTTSSANQKTASVTFATSSVLASGKWYKIGTTQNAIYKIDKTFLQNLGISTGAGGIDPRNIKIYGNGGEILSEYNGDFHYDDLNENAIYAKGDTDGVFDNTDYILFYGQAPDKWKYSEGNINTTRYYTRYWHNKHYYSDTVFYFLTTDGAPGKRIQQQASSASAPSYTVNAFDDYAVHENDQANLIISGRELYGENFDNTQQYTFNFNFPNIIQNDSVWLKTSLVGRRILPLPGGTFQINYPGSNYQVNFNPTDGSFDTEIGFDILGSGATHFMYSGGSNISITVDRIFPDETGWLNYIWVVARRALTMVGSQMCFRDYRCISPAGISQFNLQSSAPNLNIWDVSDMFNVKTQQATFSSNNYSFNLATDTLKQFIAFDGSNYQTPSFSGDVPNQNLHRLITSADNFEHYDYIIVSHPWFLSDANQLGQFHNTKEGYTYLVVTPDEIFNEFSSGMQDIGAIRQFARMLYKRSTGSISIPKYMLLFGSGSYMLKDRNPSTNTNFVTCFETYNSTSYTASKTSDDFFGFLDDNEGLIDSTGNPAPGDAVDIGIGRIPASTLAEASGVTNKIIQYYNRTIPVASCCNGVTANAEDWRNWVCLIADDANPSSPWEITFFNQTEQFAGYVANNKRYNIDKIYEDAYQVVDVPGGRRYPDVVTAINNRIARGALLMGYSGHGGELGLSHEEIITIDQIQAWNNINNMPLFFTATCEFSRYDDPSRTSAGEYVLLNPNGGGIALFTTTREAFASDGQALGGTFYPTAINKLSNGQYPALGDIIKLTKFVQPDYLHFTLLGDPALKLSYPKQDISTYKINQHITQTNVNDTVSALGKYTVTGFIADTNGHQITTFNGTIYPTIFDKPVTLTTLNNSQNTPASSMILPFSIQKNSLYRGEASVTNGNFQFSFITPKDILYNFGYGKISYYAQTDTTDAAGYYSQIMVGGSSNNPIVDNQGPGIKLFMNDNQFVVGGTTNENPYIYAEVSDSSGVNTTGNGLGHDIVATLDANTSHQYVLNDYYQADLNRYQSGKVKYQITSLTEGTHNLTVKVWDVLNNSSVSATSFVVAKSAEMALAHVLNYPNPFSNATKFFIEHNQSCDYLTVEVQIFTITGKLVKTIMETVHTEGFRIEGINWDGRDDFGDKLARGVYIYKVTVKNNEGNKADKIEKLVILN